MVSHYRIETPALAQAAGRRRPRPPDAAAGLRVGTLAPHKGFDTLVQALEMPTAQTRRGIVPSPETRTSNTNERRSFASSATGDPRISFPGAMHGPHGDRSRRCRSWTSPVMPSGLVQERPWCGTSRPSPPDASQMDQLERDVRVHPQTRAERSALLSWRKRAATSRARVEASSRRPRPAREAAHQMTPVKSASQYRSEMEELLYTSLSLQT